MNMSYDSSNLTTPDIKWLGVRPSDLDRFNIPQQCRLPMSDEVRTGALHSEIGGERTAGWRRVGKRLDICLASRGVGA